jgi:PAS domain S-box-containing protein
MTQHLALRTIPPVVETLEPREHSLASLDVWELAEEAANLGRFELDCAAGRLRASAQLRRIYGLPEQALPIEAWLACVHPEDRARIEQAREDAVARRARDQRIEHRSLRGEETRWISARLRYEYDACGALRRISGVGQDITERFTTMMGNSHLAAIVASSGEAIKSYDFDGRILSWNPAAERLFGYTAEEALGQNILMLVPDDRRDELAHKLAAVRAGEEVRIETYRRRKDGSLVEVSLNASPIRDAQGRVIAVSSLVHEITPRKQAQRALERYKLLSEHARDIMLILRASDGAVVESNAAALKAYGYSRAELAQRTIIDLRAPETRDGVSRDFARASQGVLFETTHMRADGSMFPVEVSAVGTVIEGEKLILSLIRDISDRKEWASVQRLMTRELLHRVKNSVAVIQSLVRLTAPRVNSLEEFVVSLSGRLSAMAAAHDLLTDMHWRGADLGELVAKQLAAYLVGPSPRVRMSGPRVRLPQHYAVPLALALHELATNAAKHGSLSAPYGRVDLVWSLEGPRSRKLRLEWRESGGPRVSEPATKGFGSTLIERGLPGARVERRFSPEGLACSIELDVAPRRARAKRASGAGRGG